MKDPYAPGFWCSVTILGTVTQVMPDNPFCGLVLAQGEQWQAQCATVLQAGQNVRVTARHGVMLQVSAAAAAQGE